MTVAELKEILESYDNSMEIILLTNDLPWKPLREVAVDQLHNVKTSIQVIALK